LYVAEGSILADREKKREGGVKVGPSRSVQREHATCKVTFQTKSNKCFIDGGKTHTASKQMCNGLINNTKDLSVCEFVHALCIHILLLKKQQKFKVRKKKKKTP